MVKASKKADFTESAETSQDEFETKNEQALKESIPSHGPTFSAIAKSMDEFVGASVPKSILDIPDDVKKNIVGYDDMELEQLLLKCLASYAHPINVDRIILTLWVNHKRQADRTKVMALLRVMAAGALIEKLPGARGTYSITEAGKQAREY